MKELDIYEELRIPVIPVERKYWLVRTKSGIFFNDFYLNDYIAIGWDELNDISLMTEEKREIFIEELQENIRQIPDNILYQDLLDEDEIIVNDIFEVLLQKEKITREDLLKIYENHNNCRI